MRFDTASANFSQSAKSRNRPLVNSLATLADELSARRVPAPGGIPGSAPTRPTGQRIPIELAPANSTSADPTLAKLAHHLEAALRMPNTRVEPREACAPGTPASSALQTVEHAAAAVPQPQLHAVGVPDPRFRRAEANPSPEPLLYDSDSLAQGMANLLGRR